MWTQRRQDVALAAGLAIALVVLELRDAPWWATAVTVAACAGLIWRRSHPIALFAVVAPLFVAAIVWHLEFGMPMLFIGWLALYGIPAYATRRQAIIVGLTVLVIGIGVIVYMALAVNEETQNNPFAPIFLATAYVATAWFLGRYHQAIAERAAADERARIARELHDMLAHTMSGMVVLAGGARKIARDKPELAITALERIEAAGRNGMAETRMLLRALRDGPEPSLADLSTLVEQLRETGLPVELSTVGDPADVPLAVSVAAYRIVQESLVNVLRHAGPATAKVGLRYRPDELEVEITDNGRGQPSEPGHGIAGMRERAGLAGGELRAGPRPDGGWAVRATFPVTS
jgi:signal transduction histidine kinase